MKKPPAFATWMLHCLGYTRFNPSLAGDLVEEFQNGRSSAWYWRQTAAILVNGIAKNAVNLHSYCLALIAGFTAQALVMGAEWSLRHSSDSTNGPMAAVSLLEALLLLGGWRWVAVTRRRVKLPAMSHLKTMVLAQEAAQHSSTLLTLAFVNAFVSYLPLSMNGVVFLHLSPVQLIGWELCWFAIWTVGPALLPAPAAARTSFTSWLSGQAQEDALPVVLDDGRTILLRPGAIAQSAFEAADPKLIDALFQPGASLETLRRAIWLGRVRRSSAITTAGLARLVAKVGRTESLETFFYPKPAGFWTRLSRRIDRFF